jgi:hypothetical protein
MDLADDRKLGGSRESATQLLVATTVALAALAIVLHWTPPGPHFLFWLLACFVSEALWIRLPVDRATISMASCFNFSAVLLLEPGEAMAASACASLPAELVFMRKTPIRALYNAAHTALAVGAAAAALQLGHASPVEPTGVELLPLVAAAAAYYVINRFAVSLAVGVSGGIGPLSAWRQNFGNPCDPLVSAAVLSIGAMLAMLYLQAGMKAAALVLFPLVVACDGYRRYLAWREARRDDEDHRAAA